MNTVNDGSTEKMTVNQKLELLRTKMKERGMDAYMVPTADFHESEYVGDHFKCRQFLTGFTGSAGIAVVTMKEACLWVDGRYFVQAAVQLQGTSVKMMKMGQEGVPSVAGYLEAEVPENGCLGFDGRVVNALTGIDLEKRLKEKNARILCSDDLINEIWEDRPALSMEPAWALHEKYAGKTAEEKLKELRAEMKKEHTDMYVLTSLDDIAWLLNIRGNDIAYNPVVLSYVIVTEDKLYLFVNEEVLHGEAYPYMDNYHNIDMLKYLEDLGTEILPYDDIYKMATDITGHKILMEKQHINYALYNILKDKNELVDKMNPTSDAKAVKNEVEIENGKKAHIKDGVAVTRFIYWLKHHIGKERLTEMSVQDKLEEFRKEQEGYIEPSFATISAYGANAAMCHYSATKESDTVLEDHGFYLVDSGGQYYEGTTDITRTIALGELTEEEKEHFTLVLISMLRLKEVKFLYGCRGLSLDYVAREPFWSRGLNFDHGTGHGVGYLLNVHERPNGIRFRMVPERHDNGVLEAGMITSDEPGLYIEGSHGIRTENLILCVKDEKNQYGQFMKFEFLTFVPVDKDAVVKELMTERDIALLNAYHKEVFEKISPYMDDQEKEWLRKATAPI